MQYGSFLKAVAEALKRLNFTVLIYLGDDRPAVSLYKGGIDEAVIPDAIMTYVKDDRYHCKYFASGDTLMVLYFIRFKLQNQKYVMIIQDNKRRTRLNRFVTELLNMTGAGAYMGVDDHTTLIKELKDMASDLGHEKAGFREEIENLIRDKSKSVEDLLAEIERMGLKRNVDAVETDEQDLLRLWQDAAGEEINDLKALAITHREAEKKLVKTENELAYFRAELDKVRAENQLLKSRLDDTNDLPPDEAVEAQPADVKDAGTDEIQKLKMQILELKALTDGYEQEYVRLTDEMDDKDRLLADMQDAAHEAGQARERLLALEQELAGQVKLSHDMEGNCERLGSIINALPQPLFTVSAGYNILLTNSALVAFKSASGEDELRGHVCHDVVYGSGSPCEWCMVDKVRQSGEPALTSIVLETETGERNFDLTFMPVFDKEGTLTEVAELIDDMTEMYELNNTMTKFKTRMREFKHARVEDVNELSTMKATCAEMGLENERLFERNAKLVKVVERLVSEDKAQELLETRMEIVSLRNKLVRSTEMVKSYKYQLSDQILKYSNLNKRTFMQMERLINILRAKPEFKHEEISAMMAFLTREFGYVKKHFLEERQQAAHPANEPPDDKKYTSVEELLLSEKLARKRAAESKAAAKNAKMAKTGEEPPVFDDPDDEVPPELHAKLTTEYKKN